MQYMGAQLVSIVFPRAQTSTVEPPETFPLGPMPYSQIQECH